MQGEGMYYGMCWTKSKTKKGVLPAMPCPPSCGPAMWCWRTKYTPCLLFLFLSLIIGVVHALATPITTHPTLLLIFARRNQSAAPSFGLFLCRFTLRTKTNSAHTHNSNMQQQSALSKVNDKWQEQFSSLDLKERQLRQHSLERKKRHRSMLTGCQRKTLLSISTMNELSPHLSRAI